MPNLKDLKIRIDSVKSTQKITSAMKMVAAAKLRRAQEAAEAARPYAVRMERMLGSLAQSVGGTDGAPKLLAGTGANQTHLLVAFTADRGLCGGFNGSIVRQVRTMIMDLKATGKAVKVFCVGRKGHDVLKREFPDEIIENTEGLGRRGIEGAPKRGETYLKPPGSCKTKWPVLGISVEVECCEDCAVYVLDVCEQV